jgi:hypothetical protein
MAVQDQPRYAEFKAAFERLISAEDRLVESPDLERETAQAEQASALSAYQKICDELRM